MKKILTLLFLFISVLIYSQNVDTVIVKDNYKSYFSYETRIPLFVVYTLYKGGGDCSRKGMVFTTGGLEKSATDKDYLYSGYEKGHLVNAEDFAYDCNLEKLTFFYFNTIPQTKKLNRGIWKKHEFDVRLQSQNDSLFIICGGFDFSEKIKIGEVSVPKYCFKIISNEKTHQIVYYVYRNDNSNTFEEVSQSDMFKYLPKNYQILINKILY